MQPGFTRLTCLFKALTFSTMTQSVAELPQILVDPDQQLAAESNAALREENRWLREQLHAFKTEAQRNNDIMQRHQAFDLELISSASFPDLLNRILNTLRQVSNLEIVTLNLLDEDGDIHHVMNNLGVQLEQFSELQFIETLADLSAVFMHHSEPPNLKLQPVMGAFCPDRHDRQFPPHLLQPQSIAILPLIRNRHLIGTLNLGSMDAERFYPGLGTDFIKHMASIIAISLENVISNELLKYIGLTDALTGVYNRRYIDRRLPEEAARARRHGHALSCLYLDIDHFKQVNDTLGHLAGDEVLRETAHRIKTELRQSDALARFGGEEFVALLSNTDLSSAMIVAERIRASMANTLFSISHSNPIPITISIGIASLTDNDRHESIDAIGAQLLAKADHALYEAKEGGRNRVVSFESI
jgi:two-component system, cell cycle response regulator